MISGPNDIDFFCGEITSAAARLYVRALHGEPGTRLIGAVRGPRCAFARTLAASTPLSPVRSTTDGASPLWQAVVPDPCCWSPEQPFLYDLQLEIRGAGSAIESYSATVGFRPLGVANGRLNYAGKPYRLLACQRQAAPGAPWSEWRDAEMAMIVDRADDETCRPASEAGVWLIVAIDIAEDLAEQLRRLARWPAVAAVLLPENADQVDVPRNLAAASAAETATSAGRLQLVSIDEHGPLPELTAQEAAGSLFCLDQPAASIGLAAARERCLAVARKLEYAGFHDISGILV